jgi:hypothetical protein
MSKAIISLVAVALLSTLGVEAREGPECPTDPYVSVVVHHGS